MFCILDLAGEADVNLAEGAIAAGVGAMVVFTAWGGIGGHSGHSLWWGLFVLPYPLGWIIGLVGAILRLAESFKRPFGSHV